MDERRRGDAVMRAPVALILVVLVALAPLGCAHRHPAPATSLPEKPETGTVALVVSSAAPYAWFQRPGVVGTGDGAKRGAKVGATATIVPGVFVITNSGADPRVVLFGLGMLGAGLVLAPVGAGVGAAIGAIAAPASEEVEQAAAILDRALTEANLADALTVLILDAAGERPITAGTAAESAAADTVLEIGAISVHLGSKDPTDWKPRLRLRVTIDGRLVRASDSEVLRSWMWEHEGPEARFVDWAKDDGRRFREELRNATQVLTARIIADVF